MSALESLKIGFWNSQGLSIHKWNSLLKSFYASSFDIFFVVETWFVDHALHSSHPLYLTSSFMAGPKPATGHNKAGLLCLITPSLRPFVSSISSSSNSIFLSLGGHSLHCAYLPPSMTISSVKEFLPSSSISVFLGDLNTHFGKLLGSSRSGPPQRIDLFDDLASSLELVQLLPVPAGNTPDHCFVRNDLTGTWSFCPRICTGLSDHKVMSCTLSGLTLPVPPPLSSDSFKFHLKPLDVEDVVDQLIELYDDSSSSLAPVLALLPKLSHSKSLDQVQFVLELAYESWKILVSSVCSAILGVYSVHDAKSSANSSDPYLNKLFSSSSQAQNAALLFKKSQKSNIVKTTVASRSPSLSAIEDACLFFKDEVFGEFPPECLSGIESFPPSLDFEEIPNLGLWFSPWSVKHAISKYPSSKSAGPDPFHSRIYKVLSSSKVFLNELSCLFTHFAKFCYTPREWNVSHIHPIPKQSDSRTINQFRPIALTNMCRRLFESCLLGFLVKSLPLHSSQAGFRKGFSTLTHSVVSNDLFKVHGPLASKDRIFIDLKQAYDRVITPILLYKLSQKGLPKQLILLVGSLFSVCSSTISINGVRSSPFPRLKGLFQGSLLSPLLFNVYIDDLANELASFSQLAPAALLFADDIQLLPTSESMAISLIQVLSNWCSRNGMVINVFKSAYVGSSGWSLSINGSPLPCQPVYTYLGFPTSSSGIDFSLLVEKYQTKAAKFLKYFQLKGKSWHPLIRLYLFRSFLRSLWEYGAPLIHCLGDPSILLPLHSLQVQALAWVVGCSDKVASQYKRLISSLCAVESIDDRFSTLAIKFVSHLEKSHSTNPLAHLIQLRKVFTLEFSPSALVSRNIFNPPVFTSFQSMLADSTHDAALQSLKLITLSKTSSSTDRISLIKPKSRHPKSLVDVSFYFKSKRLADQALRWRMNRFCLGAKCPKCLKAFYHTHVPRCFSITDTDDLFSFDSQPALQLRLTNLLYSIMPDVAKNLFN